MNASTWKKAADIVAKTTSVTPQASAAATMESHNLQSLQLSTLFIDDSRPPQVTYESQQPIATSTPQATDNSETPTEAYHQILPGMTSQLYPTLVADSSLEMHVLDQQDTLKHSYQQKSISTSRRWQRSEKWMLITLTHNMWPQIQ